MDREIELEMNHSAVKLTRSRDGVHLVSVLMNSADYDGFINKYDNATYHGAPITVDNTASKPILINSIGERI